MHLKHEKVNLKHVGKSGAIAALREHLTPIGAVSKVVSADPCRQISVLYQNEEEHCQTMEMTRENVAFHTHKRKIAHCCNVEMVGARLITRSMHVRCLQAGRLCNV